ncbi:PaaI family thioesterase [Desertibaculum subflavum]|uniref:PaaI family thioesterase n=1 Tax=Desertibaculum subflavum TaxID=2268458 RepID=UPI000E67195A
MKPIPEGFELVPPRGGFTPGIADLYVKREGEGIVRGVRVEPRHLNVAGIAHGGFLATMMDSTFGNSLSHTGRRGFTVRLVTDYLSPAKRGDWLEGRARITRATQTLAFLEGELTVEGRVVIKGQAVFALRQKKGPADRWIQGPGSQSGATTEA